MKLINSIKAWLNNRKQNPNRARFLSKSERLKSKQPTKPYFVTMEVEIKGHKVGSFPITVLAINKNHARAIILKETKVTPGIIRNPKKYGKNA